MGIDLIDALQRELSLHIDIEKLATSAFTFKCFAHSVAASALTVATSAFTFKCFAPSVKAEAATECAKHLNVKAEVATVKA
ncbi:hypothetical protein LC574_37620, partial [Nostoc sp. CHAB 5715]|nr:hypothetical protein [Nostoc sp. CHAB 5715]